MNKKYNLRGALCNSCISLNKKKQETNNVFKNNTGTSTWITDACTSRC